jgi:hypothetical protein
MHDLLNLHPLEPQGIRANVPPSHGPVQPGHALDFHASTAHLQKAHAGRAGNRTGQGYMARQAILTRTAKEWGVTA